MTSAKMVAAAKQEAAKHGTPMRTIAVRPDTGGDLLSSRAARPQWRQHGRDGHRQGANRGLPRAPEQGPRRARQGTSGFSDDAEPDRRGAAACLCSTKANASAASACPASAITTSRSRRRAPRRSRPDATCDLHKDCAGSSEPGRIENADALRDCAPVFSFCWPSAALARRAMLAAPMR